MEYHNPNISNPELLYERLMQNTLRPEEEALFAEAFIDSLDDKATDTDPKATERLLSEHISKLATSGSKMALLLRGRRRHFLRACAAASIAAIVAVSIWIMRTPSETPEILMADAPHTQEIIPTLTTATEPAEITGALPINIQDTPTKKKKARKKNSSAPHQQEIEASRMALIGKLDEIVSNNLTGTRMAVEEMLADIETTIGNDDGACIMCSVDDFEYELTAMVQTLKESHAENWTVQQTEVSLIQQ